MYSLKSVNPGLFADFWVIVLSGLYVFCIKAYRLPRGKALKG